MQLKDYDLSDSPTLTQFYLDDTSHVLGIRGPFGSGKSVCCIQKILRFAQSIPKNKRTGKRQSRILVVRNSYRELEDTTIRSWLEWVPENVFGIYKRQSKIHEVRFNDVEMDVLFRSLDTDEDVRKILSLEISAAWINEAREIPWVIIKNVQGRLGRYPIKHDIVKDYNPQIIMDTNSPDSEHWWYKFAEVETPNNFKFYSQPGGLDPKAENIRNLPTNYYQRMMQGADDEWIKVHVHNEYGFILEGKPVYPEYRDMIHSGETIPNIQCDLIRGWDFGLCYSDDTEVLTDSGFKFFKDVDITKDKIASRNPENGVVEYHDAAFKVDQPFEGELLQWESQNINFCVTPEHIIPYTNRDTPNKVHWKSAEELAKELTAHRYVDLIGNFPWKTTNPTRPDGWDMVDYARFMGIYLSEGSSDGKKVNIYQKEQDPYFESILKTTPYNWKWIGDRWTTNNSELARELKELGVAATKRVPRSILNCTPFTILQFITTYTWGDGHIRDRDNGGQEHTIYTISSGMADDLQEAALKVGWTSSKRWVPAQENQHALKCGRVIKGQGGWSITFKKTLQRAELLPEHFSRVSYKGRVYCLNVPYHTLYVRRKGVPSWNGNTPACVFLQIDPKGRVSILDEITSEDMGIDRFSDVVITHTKTKYSGYKVQDYGDPAGMGRSQTDERTCFDILWAKGIKIEGGKQDPTIRIESVKKALNTMVEGRPGLVVNPKCVMLRKGFMGGYQYRKLKVSGWVKYSDKPDKNQFSHCLVAGTQIETAYGPKPIENIVVGDVVITPLGQRVVERAWESGEFDTYTVEFDNGAVLQGTANHKVVSNGSLKPISDLATGDIATSLEEVQQWKKLQSLWNSMGGSTDFLTLVDQINSITGQKTGGLLQNAISTELFGQTPTVPFQMDTTSTIGMITHLITSWVTWRSFTNQTTPRYMVKNVTEEIRKLLASTWHSYRNLPKTGTILKQVENGTVSMAERLGKVENQNLEFAQFVAKSSSIFSIAGSIVDQIASNRQDAPEVMTTSKEFVQFVEKTLWLINTKHQSVAPRVVRVYESEKRKVYNLTVETDHVYYANGILVGNCHDALQYPLTVLYGASLVDPYHSFDEEEMEQEYNEYDYRGRNSMTGY